MLSYYCSNLQYLIFIISRLSVYHLNIKFLHQKISEVTILFSNKMIFFKSWRTVDETNQEKERKEGLKIIWHLIIELGIEFKINSILRRMIYDKWFRNFPNGSSDFPVKEFKLWYPHVLTYIFRSTCNGIYSTEFLIQDAHTLRIFEIDFLKNEHCYVEPSSCIFNSFFAKLFLQCN